MPSQSCLFALVRAERERHEEVVQDLVSAGAAEFRASPHLDSLFFARYNEPSWQVRFRVLGRPDWVEGPVRERMISLLEPLRERGAIEGYEFAKYDREIDRYGGDLGMALAEEIFLHDTLACLDFMDAERKGLVTRSRREFSLLLTERLLDLLRFDRETRLAFHAFGYRWAIDLKTWEEDELRILDGKYAAIHDGLRDLVLGDGGDPVWAWGGEEPHRIAETYVRSVGPVVERLLAAHDEGLIRQDPVYLAWSYAHMQCNRLGIDPTPEAILRYFMHRLLREPS